MLPAPRLAFLRPLFVGIVKTTLLTFIIISSVFLYDLDHKFNSIITKKNKIIKTADASAVFIICSAGRFNSHPSRGFWRLFGVFLDGGRSLSRVLSAPYPERNPNAFSANSRRMKPPRRRSLTLAAKQKKSMGLLILFRFCYYI